jgi:type IV secretion system protein VirB1
MKFRFLVRPFLATSTLTLMLFCATAAYGVQHHRIAPPISDAVSEANTKLAPLQFNALSMTCAAMVAPQIMAGIAKTESAFYPYAISINYPLRKAHQYGYSGKAILVRQPHSKTEAIHWARWYLARGYTVSVGLVQVNVEMAGALHVKPMTLFDPCINLAAGARILREDYAHASGLTETYSLYNSGSASMGIESGYASTVIRNSHSY